jgi:hypothetical protein
MMKTPVSAFDLFLLRLYEGAKCNDLVKNDNADEADLCMTALTYDEGSSELSAFLRLYPGGEPIRRFH